MAMPPPIKRGHFFSGRSEHNGRGSDKVKAAHLRAGSIPVQVWQGDKPIERAEGSNSESRGIDSASPGG